MMLLHQGDTAPKMSRVAAAEGFQVGIRFGIRVE